MRLLSQVLIDGISTGCLLTPRLSATTSHARPARPRNELATRDCKQTRAGLWAKNNPGPGVGVLCTQFVSVKLRVEDGTSGDVKRRRRSWSSTYATGLKWTGALRWNRWNGAALHVVDSITFCRGAPNKLKPLVLNPQTASNLRQLILAATALHIDSSSARLTHSSST